MCGGDCTSILEPAAADFPSSTRFATYLQPNSGHALNIHLNASAYYDVILGFLEERVPQLLRLQSADHRGEAGPVQVSIPGSRLP